MRARAASSNPGNCAIRSLARSDQIRPTASLAWHAENRTILREERDRQGAPRDPGSGLPRSRTTPGSARRARRRPGVVRRDRRRAPPGATPAGARRAHNDKLIAMLAARTTGAPLLLVVVLCATRDPERIIPKAADGRIVVSRRRNGSLHPHFFLAHPQDRAELAQGAKTCYHRGKPAAAPAS